MSDRTGRNRDAVSRANSADVCRLRPPTPEQSRIGFALARADHHSIRELYFLELAVAAPDEDSANALEIYAYEAYKDAEAIKKEHDLDS